MNSEYPGGFPSKERAVVGAIDISIDSSRISLKNNLERLQKKLSTASLTQLYSEPTYAADVLPQLPEAIDTPTIHLFQKETDALVESHNRRADYVGSLSSFEQKLLAPVPDFSLAREIKNTYRDIRIDDSHPLHDEPVVSLRDYGIACQAYYSRRNGATGDPVPGVKPDVYVRKNIAERMQKLNRLLDTPEATNYFGGEVEIFVDEGWRDPELQRYLHDTVIPNLVRKELIAEGLDKALSPEEFEQRVRSESDHKIARPPTNKDDSPSPHATGAALDFAIRLRQDTPGIANGVNIPMGRGVAQMTKRTNPDDFEHEIPVTIEERIAQQNRRAQHALLGMVGLVQNPTEFWHASKGDQLASIVNEEAPYYGWADHSAEKYDG